ncbi:MAG: ATP-binding cassette domain-containing protein [Rubrobacteraceae bacterium]|uniref:ATP-binding cassette domain-containing protein n=1 Tax=Rubrobacter naiadicus TaxID=1392641 RepID=UPI00236100CE|nr:ATP-binding cassette domain-containing protein [Rubrobacter naiadicus]MBX6765189.1 sugar ABC transporter ATP-binding protein [Rubrobacteraceae bacterium]MCL6437797.1 ATP-binding cassette domain-containing protein [Rubrobacteraceae bacterium]
MSENGATSEDILRAEGIVKRFGSVVALRGITMHLKKGEVLGIVGDNGAGKSTLMKILTGFHKPDEGKIFLEGQEIELKSVSHAQSLGIQVVYQDLALANDMTVYENMFLNREITHRPFRFLNKREMKRKTRQYLDDIGVNIPSIDEPVARLSGGQRQAIAVARAVYSANPKILLLDEPLAAMGAKEATMIMDLIQRLRRDGEVSIIMIDHNYAHIFGICDRVNLIQHGEITYDKPTAETSMEELTELVVEEYRRARAS